MVEQRGEDVRVREMRLGDAAAVADLSGQLGYAANEAQMARRIAGLLGREDHALLVAAVGEEWVVGWIHVCRVTLLEQDPRAEVWGLVVDAAERGKGIGRRLMAAAEAWATERGLSAMGLSSRRHREDAHRFYERLGYEVVKTSLTFRKTLP